MSTQSTVMPGEGDVAAVEQRLAELWSDLTPAQQALLDTIITAGMTIVGTGDTAGYMMPSLLEMQAHVEARRAEIQEDWRRANTTVAAGSAGAAKPVRRWDLRPVLDWFRRAPAPQPGGSATA